MTHELETFANARREHGACMANAIQHFSKEAEILSFKILHNAQPVDQGSPVHKVPEHARSTFSRLSRILCQGLHTTWSHTFSRKWLRRQELLRKGVWDARLQQQT